MSVPNIGAVEFIVKFDTMEREFVRSLREALKDTDLDLGVDPQIQKDIDEIKRNLMYRVRTPFSGDWFQLKAAGAADITYAQSEEAITRLGKRLQYSKTGMKRFGIREGETEEEHAIRTKEIAKKFLGAFAKEIEQGMKDPAYWEANKAKIIALANQKGGAWKSLRNG